MLDYIAVGMVLDAPHTGYEIKKFIENGIGVFYKASYGSLYPALKKLADKGWLSLYEQPQGGRQKKFYQATQTGRDAFFQWLASPLEAADGGDSRLAKVYFFDRLPADVRLRQLREYERGCLEYLRRLESLEEHFRSLDNKDCFYFKLSTLYYGIRIMRDNIRWCRHLMDGRPLGDLLEELK